MNGPHQEKINNRQYNIGPIIIIKYMCILCVRYNKKLFQYIFITKLRSKHY